MRYGPRQIAQLRAGMPPTPTVRKKRDNAEFRIQSAFVALWRANCKSLGIARQLGFAIPNGSVMGGGSAEWQKTERAIRGKLQKIAGVEPGVVDWFLSVPSGKWHGFYVEFKKPDGVLSEDQERFIGFATARGYRCEVHTSATEAWAALLEYVNLP